MKKILKIFLFIASNIFSVFLIDWRNKSSFTTLVHFWYSRNDLLKNSSLPEINQ